MPDDLAHDVASAACCHLVEIVSPALREEERGKLFDEFYAVVRASLQAYEAMRPRESPRLEPSNN